MQDCWKADAKERPSFHAIAKALETYVEEELDYLNLDAQEPHAGDNTSETLGNSSSAETKENKDTMEMMDTRGRDKEMERPKDTDLKPQEEKHCEEIQLGDNKGVCIEQESIGTTNINLDL